MKQQFKRYQQSWFWLIIVCMGLCFGHVEAAPKRSKTNHTKKFKKASKRMESLQEKARRARKKITMLKMGAIGVRGKRHKPQVLYVLGRNKIVYKQTVQRQSYLKQVISSVRKSPF